LKVKDIVLDDILASDIWAREFVAAQSEVLKHEKKLLLA
jgi:hypothetical protein